METVTIKCVQNGVTAIADVLEKSDKRLKVAFKNSDITVVLYKKDPKSKLYGGSHLGLHFECEV